MILWFHELSNSGATVSLSILIHFMKLQFYFAAPSPRIMSERWWLCWEYFHASIVRFGCNPCVIHVLWHKHCYSSGLLNKYDFDFIMPCIMTLLSLICRACENYTSGHLNISAETCLVCNYSKVVLAPMASHLNTCSVLTNTGLFYIQN